MQSRQLKRRDFITLLGSAAATWPLAARAQQPDRMQRIGVLIAVKAQDDPIAQARVGAFREELEKLGWKEGHNLRIDARFAAAESGRIQTYAAELARLKPDVVLAQTSVAVTALLRESPSLPLVFVHINDPVDSGFVASLARPGRQYHRLYAGRVLDGRKTRISRLTSTMRPFYSVWIKSPQ
jgi:putative ABC transport system substrate-binding protein